MKRDLYTEVSARIVAELERGAAPWIKPWSATPGQNVPQNAVTSRPYSGCNVILHCGSRAMRLGYAPVSDLKLGAGSQRQRAPKSWKQYRSDCGGP